MSSDRLRREMMERQQARAVGRPVNGGIMLPTAQQQQQALGQTFVQTFLACVPAVAGSSTEMTPDEIVSRAESIALATMKKMGIEIQLANKAATEPPAPPGISGT